VNGYSKTFIASANNNGNATTINGKHLYKPSTTTSPVLVNDKAYTVWYNSTGDCFFIKASAEGNTIASHVLAGDTFSNDDDTGLIGTMPNMPAESNFVTTTINDGNVHMWINSGAYLKLSSGGYPNIVFSPTSLDSNISSSNIKAGKSILGISGSATVVDTSDANALASQIVSGSTAYVKGNKIIGTADIRSLGGMAYSRNTVQITNTNTYTFNNLGIGSLVNALISFIDVNNNNSISGNFFYTCDFFQKGRAIYITKNNQIFDNMVSSDDTSITVKFPWNVTGTLKMTVYNE
jgi:hypothetical protein